jgi:choline dehydrogenase
MYDYIIVGAGSAGCVLANRLSADRDCKVLLIEAGPRDWHPFIHMPAGIAKLVGKKNANWDYYTEPEAQLGGRRLWWPRGRVLGGSSSINAMCYTRGHHTDYDEWERLGARGWNWQSALPAFRLAEGNSRGASLYHGGDGPLSVMDHIHTNPLSQVFLDAAQQAGHASTQDFNGAEQDGFGFYQVTQRKGSRCSTAVAYLNPARDRPNLSIVTGAQAQHLLFESGRTVGLRYLQGHAVREARAQREVILCGGALNSPQLLMLSGIGPAAQLRRHGIEVRVDAPGVGHNLQDHLDICTLTQASNNLSYDTLSDLSVAWQYYLFGRGPGTSNVAETGGFLRSHLAQDARPDIQFHFVPAMLDDHGRNRLPGSGYTLHACFLRPKSRGHLELASTNPNDKIRIHANYLSDAEGFDLKVMVECVKLSREILAQTAFKPHRKHELMPGDTVQDAVGIIDFIRRKAETIYHPVGTCRMGEDEGAVVDSELRVRGVEGLRVVDASVMPSLVGGNTNAPTVMIAERAAAFIAGR